jgi:hypothetical protein
VTHWPDSHTRPDHTDEPGVVGPLIPRVLQEDVSNDTIVVGFVTFIGKVCDGRIDHEDYRKK